MKFNFDNFFKIDINVKRTIEYENLLTWFIGFSEGDASWQFDEKSKRNYFIINQKDPKVLYKIKKILQCVKFENIIIYFDSQYLTKKYI